MFYEKKADEMGHLLFSKYDEENWVSYESVPHFHGSIEIFLCIEGTYTVYIDGTVYKLKPGDVAFVDRFVSHTSGTCEGDEPPATVYVVVASSTYLDDIKWLDGYTLPPVTLCKAGYERIKDLVVWAYDLKDDMNEEMRCGFVALLLGLMRDYCGRVERADEKNASMLIDVIRYIDDHYSEKLDLDSLSKNFGYEKTYLSRSFNKFFGMNLREYINRRRVIAFQRIRREDKSIPILKVAEMCGFDSPNTYYRAMAKYSDKKHNF